MKLVSIKKEKTQIHNFFNIYPTAKTYKRRINKKEINLILKSNLHANYRIHITVNSSIKYLDACMITNCN